MLLKIKKALADAASDLGENTFKTLDFAELQKYAQEHDFNVDYLIRLEPVEDYEGSIDPGGVVRNNMTIKLWFLTIFRKDNDKEDDKDVLIDRMEDASNDYNRILNNSQSINHGSLTRWRTKIVRQITSNLLCGVMCTLTLDTPCSRT